MSNPSDASTATSPEDAISIRPLGMAELDRVTGAGSKPGGAGDGVTGIPSRQNG